MARGQLVAEGTYEYFSAGASAGQETWQISQLGRGGIVISSRAEFSAPEAYIVNLDFELTRAWSPRSLTIRLEQNGEVLNSTQRIAGNKWLAQVEGARVANYELPFSNQHEVDVRRSALTVMVTLVRTTLPFGQTRELDVIFVRVPSLEAITERQSYEALAEEKIEVPAGEFSALKYHMTRIGVENAVANQFWADHHGVPLLYRGGDLEMKLTHYRRHEARAPRRR